MYLSIYLCASLSCLTLLTMSSPTLPPRLGFLGDFLITDLHTYVGTKKKYVA